MGSTGEPDRKRRHCNSISPTAASLKKQPFSPLSEDKKLDITVLQYQNQKLIQKLETQKVDYSALESKLAQLNIKQEPYDSTLTVVNKSLEELVNDFESRSIHIRESCCKHVARHNSVVEDGVPSVFQEAFLSRLTETGATESSSIYSCSNKMQGNRERAYEKTNNTVRNILAAIDSLWHLKDGLHAILLKNIPKDGSCKQKTSSDLVTEVRNLRMSLCDLFFKHRILARELQSHQDMDAKNKVKLKIVNGELESALGELEDINSKVATLKAQRDGAKGAVFPILNLGSKHMIGDKVNDKAKDLQDMESYLKELKEQSSCRLMEIKVLHEERVRILEQLYDLQNALKNLTCNSSSEAYLLVRDQIEKSKSQVFEYQALYEKLQAEKDSLIWRERELNVKNDVVDVVRRSAAVVDSRVTDIRMEIQKQIDERKNIEKKLEEASRDPGRKEIIAEFKSLVSSFPEEMGTMQGKLRKFKETASDVHSLRADVQSLCSILDRKVKDCEILSSKSADQVAEIQNLQALVQDLQESDLELKLILEMFGRESYDSREVLEARDLEYKAWARVQSLKSSLDEHNLEIRVKTANKAEAMSQMRLATAEAEFAELRHGLERSRRDKTRLSGVLKSKNEEKEAYLSEIETIGQAYDDMQTQNQQLLQQITERDDYNIKLVLEGVGARQLQDSLMMEKRSLEKEIKQAKSSLNFYDVKAARIEDQLRICSDHVHMLTEDKCQSSVTLESVQKRLLDVRRSSQQAHYSLEASQSKSDKSRMGLLELQIELERERFEKRRLEEELKLLRRKASCLQAQMEGSSIIEKLQQELGDYREILKCAICLDRTKQVVITKCYHLFCNPCVQKILETRHRKCPTCSASFGPNDVKSVYI